MAAPRLTLQDVNRVEWRGLMAALDESQSLLWFQPDGRVVDANVNCQAMLASPLHELQELSILNLLNPSGKQADYFNRHWARICSGALRTEEREIYSADGNAIWCSITYAVLRDENHFPRRIFSLVIDLSPWSWKPKSDIGRVY